VSLNDDGREQLCEEESAMRRALHNAADGVVGAATLR
jgi:hypothetical protein